MIRRHFIAILVEDGVAKLETLDIHWAGLQLNDTRVWR